MTTEPRDQISAPLADEYINVADEAATEIFNLAGPGNPVAARLRKLRDRTQCAELLYGPVLVPRK